jgi:hypothetical protein
MRTREILIIGLFIIAVCTISLIPFSNIPLNGIDEGFDTNGNTTATTVGNVNATTVSVTTVPKDTISPQKTNIINNNADFIKALIYYLSRPPDRHNDKIAIYNLQGLISYIKTQNVSTLLGEIANPSNLYDPRLFLQYMNWFASHCPIDTSICTGLC